MIEDLWVNGKMCKVSLGKSSKADTTKDSLA